MQGHEPRGLHCTFYRSGSSKLYFPRCFSLCRTFARSSVEKSAEGEVRRRSYEPGSRTIPYCTTPWYEPKYSHTFLKTSAYMFVHFPRGFARELNFCLSNSSFSCPSFGFPLLLRDRQLLGCAHSFGFLMALRSFQILMAR